MTEANANDDTKEAIRNLEESSGERAKGLSRSLSLRDLYNVPPIDQVAYKRIIYIQTTPLALMIENTLLFLPSSLEMASRA